MLLLCEQYGCEPCLPGLASYLVDSILYVDLPSQVLQRATMATEASFLQGMGAMEAVELTTPTTMC